MVPVAVGEVRNNFHLGVVAASSGGPHCQTEKVQFVLQHAVVVVRAVPVRAVPVRAAVG